MYVHCILYDVLNVILRNLLYVCILYIVSTIVIISSQIKSNINFLKLKIFPIAGDLLTRNNLIPAATIKICCPCKPEGGTSPSVAPTDTAELPPSRPAPPSTSRLFRRSQRTDRVIKQYKALSLGGYPDYPGSNFTQYLSFSNIFYLGYQKSTSTTSRPDGGLNFPDEQDVDDVDDDYSSADAGGADSCVDIVLQLKALNSSYTKLQSLKSLDTSDGGCSQSLYVGGILFYSVGGLLVLGSLYAAWKKYKP